MSWNDSTFGIFCGGCFTFNFPTWVPRFGVQKGACFESSSLSGAPSGSSAVLCATGAGSLTQNKESPFATGSTSSYDPSSLRPCCAFGGCASSSKENATLSKPLLDLLREAIPEVSTPELLDPAVDKIKEESLDLNVYGSTSVVEEDVDDFVEEVVEEESVFSPVPEDGWDVVETAESLSTLGDLESEPDVEERVSLDRSMFPRHVRFADGKFFVSGDCRPAHVIVVPGTTFYRLVESHGVRGKGSMGNWLDFGLKRCGLGDHFKVVFKH